jgi:hypothetical protein
MHFDQKFSLITLLIFQVLMSFSITAINYREFFFCQNDFLLVSSSSQGTNEYALHNIDYINEITDLIKFSQLIDWEENQDERKFTTAIPNILDIQGDSEISIIDSATFIRIKGSELKRNTPRCLILLHNVIHINETANLSSVLTVNLASMKIKLQEQVSKKLHNY